MAKAKVCKTFIHRFDSDRRLQKIYHKHAEVAELVDARDLKSLVLLHVPVRVRPSALSSRGRN